MSFGIFGKNNNRRLEKIFSEHAQNAVAGARALHELLEDFNHDYIDRILEIEHIGDNLTKETHQILASTFITKIDKEDTVRLVSRLDDITDAMRGVALKIRIYRIKTSRPEMRKFAETILSMTNGVERIIEAMTREKLSVISEIAVHIKILEEEADAILHNALGKLFDEEQDAKMFVVWKKLFEELERITDHCENVADVAMTIARKQSR